MLHLLSHAYGHATRMRHAQTRMNEGFWLRSTTQGLQQVNRGAIRPWEISNQRPRVTLES